MLKKEIQELKRELNLLKASSTIPLEIDTALFGRGFVKTFDTESTSIEMTTNTGFRRTISLTGGAEDIIVPAYPVKWKKLSDQSNLYIALYTFSELP